MRVSAIDAERQASVAVFDDVPVAQVEAKQVGVPRARQSGPAVKAIGRDLVWCPGNVRCSADRIEPMRDGAVRDAERLRCLTPGNAARHQGED